MEHFMHGWKKSWCEGVRDGEMTKRNSTKEFTGNIQGEESDRTRKREIGSWVMHMERQNSMVRRICDRGADGQESQLTCIIIYIS